MNDHWDLTRRGALIAGGSLCLGTKTSVMRPGWSTIVDDLARRTMGRRRALRDGALPPVAAEIVSANLPLNSNEATLEAAAQSAALAAEAKKVGRQRLSKDDRDTLDALIWDLERDAGYARFYWHEFPLGYSGSELSTLTFLSFGAPPIAGDQDGFLQKLRQ